MDVMHSKWQIESENKGNFGLASVITTYYAGLNLNLKFKISKNKRLSGAQFKIFQTILVIRVSPYRF